MVHPSQIDFASPIHPKHPNQQKILSNSLLHMHKLFLLRYPEYYAQWELFLMHSNEPRPVQDTRILVLLPQFRNYGGNIPGNRQQILKITQGPRIDTKYYLKYMISGHVLRSYLCDKPNGKSNSSVFVTIPLPIDLPNFPSESSHNKRFVCVVDHFFTAKWKDDEEVYQFCRIRTVYKPIIERDEKTRFWILRDETYAQDKEFILPVEYIYSHVFLIKVPTRANMLYALPIKDML